MIIFVKRKAILAITVSFAIISCVVLTYFMASRVVYSATRNGLVVVIDAGHGGIDGGVSGVNTGVKESDINLAIAKNLEDYLDNHGYEVVMTRTTSDGLYGLSTTNRKAQDMQTRSEIINEAEPDLVISIHQNSFVSPTVSGAQVFYAPSSSVGQQYAETMQAIINASLNSDKECKSGDYFMLQCSSYPSLLIECGFLSNPEEEQLLITAEYQNKVAYTIYTGISTIFSDVLM